MTSVETPLGEAGVFAGMRPDHLALLARCARDAAFDARALSLVRASAVDGSCLRHRFEQDPALGYDVLSHLAQVLVERLRATRLRLLDVYGSPDRG
ncbi:hypothetical protein BBK14_26405 [Parafrankia soli]|uniref:Uncharacterized protein n=1 Tax=Parafrankia soli TaxID=2599596 RepID=A0A1S1PLI9_9ACTN|nr:hypothetical protein [Parafrankia soli]OHV21552.1 hypothetical protein BBK14_26405 [Parafrankia soli]